MWESSRIWRMSKSGSYCGPASISKCSHCKGLSLAIWRSNTVLLSSIRRRRDKWNSSKWEYMTSKLQRSSISNSSGTMEPIFMRNFTNHDMIMGLCLHQQINKLTNKPQYNTIQYNGNKNIIITMMNSSSKLFLKIGSPWTILKPTAHFCSSWNIEEHKPTPTQRKAQQQGVMSKKILLQKYQLLKSAPTDNMEQISNNYISLKKLYNGRRYYIPDKKNYLLMLDQCYQDILQVHENYNYLELGKETGLINKKEAITYQLKAIRTAEFIALLQTYEFAGFILLCFIIVQIIREQSTANTQRVGILQMFSVPSRLKASFDSFHDKKIEKYQDGKNKKQTVSVGTLKKFEKLGIQYDHKKHSEKQNILDLKKKAQEKLGIVPNTTNPATIDQGSS